MNETKLIGFLCVCLWFWVGVWGFAYWWNKRFGRLAVDENMLSGLLGPFGFILGAILYYGDKTK